MLPKYRLAEEQEEEEEEEDDDPRVGGRWRKTPRWAAGGTGPLRASQCSKVRDGTPVVGWGSNRILIPVYVMAWRKMRPKGKPWGHIVCGSSSRLHI